MSDACDEARHKAALSGRRRAGRGIRRVLAAFLTLAALLAAAWVARVPLLSGMARAWVISDPVEAADAVAIFGGGLDTRPFAAAEYYRRGLVRKVIVADVKPSPVETLGIMPSHTELNRTTLVALGVPAEAIEIFGSRTSSTVEEAAALREWGRQTGARTVIVPIEAFSARRLRWTLERFSGHAGMHLLVPALEAREYTVAEWWRSEQGLIALQNEVVKYFYYRIRYRAAAPAAAGGTPR